MNTRQKAPCGLGSITSFLEWFGELGLFVAKFASSTLSRPFHFRELLQQMHEIGTRSLPLVVLASASSLGE